MFTGKYSPMRNSCCRLLRRGGRVRAGRRSGRDSGRASSWPRSGVYKGRRPSLTPEQVTELRAQAAAGVPKTELARQYGIHRDTCTGTWPRTTAEARGLACNRSAPGGGWWLRPGRRPVP